MAEYITIYVYIGINVNENQLSLTILFKCKWITFYQDNNNLIKKGPLGLMENKPFTVSV